MAEAFWREGGRDDGGVPRTPRDYGQRGSCGRPRARLAVATHGQRHGVCATVRDDPGLRGLRMPGGWWANGVRALRGSGDLMGAAAYNRGSRLVSREADERMPVATSRADAQAHKDEIVRLREQVTTLERDLRRARRCLAAERAGRGALRARLADEESAYAFGVGVLCALAFPGNE